ncbi:hypothetical protein QBC35DRAFT_452199 [Podospora australis]|uniref:DUF1308 domain-containing protein n=1 Tax=Podospora australis TaxID=1536484 RepID=A0AAN7AIT6_9PEZI|nr:hypothetical protein QBC35DRAFT_452199 [Podospora australis]
MTANDPTGTSIVETSSSSSSSSHNDSSSTPPSSTATTISSTMRPNPEVPTLAKSLPKSSNEIQAGPELDKYVESLAAQWQACIGELTALEQAAEAAARPIRGLHALVKVQQRALDKVMQKQDAETGTISPAQFMGIRSCCWEDKWAVVKKCKGLVAINKDFPRSPRMAVPKGSGWLAFKDRPFQEKVVSVDAVVNSGATWIKFISISARTLEYQVMAEGWESDEYSDAEDSGNEKKDNADAGLGHTEFADTISKIILAARWNHCHHLHLVLPGLYEGKSDVVDRVLNYVRDKIGGTDVKVDASCAGSPFLVDAPPPLETAIPALIDERDPLVAPEDCNRITETVNLDPSALVALVTDLHHGTVPLQPAAQREIITKSVLDHETDNNELVSRQDILASVLYPALRGRKLVCTKFAAHYFRKLIDAISTHSEETRGSFILPNLDSPPLSEAELRAKLQEWSTILVPDDLHLPVEIVDDIDLPDVEPLIASGKLPPMARGVARDLSRLNRSVYLYGWAHRITTITGHRGIERQVRLSLASHWTREPHASLKGTYPDELPPDIWHRHLGGYLIHRDKPKDWREMIPEGDEVPEEVKRWTNPWTTWGRGISTYGLPDTKTWEGIGHEEKKTYGRKMCRRELKDGGSGEGNDGELSLRNANGKLRVPEPVEDVVDEEGEEEQS